jgi:hypothetical protein
MRYRLFFFLAAMVALGIGGCGGEGKSSDTLGTDSLTFGDSSGSSVLRLDPNGAVQLTAKVKDAAGKAVAEREVTFTFVSNASGATLTSASGNTNAAGEATILYRAGAVSGFDVVRALISNGARMDVSITVGGGGGGAQISLAGEPTSLAAGRNSILTATVTDSAGSPIHGQAVAFAFSINNSGATLTILNGTTDVSGKAIALYTAGAANPTANVQDTVLASVTGSAAAIVITRTVGAAGFQIAVSATPASLGVGATSIVIAQVTNADGTAAAGQAVSFAFIGGAAPSGATLAPLNGGITDAGGKALAVYTAGSLSPGERIQDAIVATVPGAVSAVIITRLPTSGVGNRISSLTAVPSTLPAAGGTSIVTATVVGSDNVTPIQGETVTFSILTGGGAGVTSTVVTGNNGRANAIFTGSGAAGTQSVVRAQILGSDAVVIINWQ